MRLVYSIIVILIVCGTARAEGADRSADATSRRPVEKWFDAVDRNDDGFIGVREAKAVAHRPGARGRFNRADQDGDHRISEDEAIDKRQQFARRVEARRRFEVLKTRHREHNLTDAAWLGRHPEVADRLVDNEYFLREHPHVLAALAKNDEFVKSRPNVAQRIAGRHQWRQDHPNAAQRMDHRRDFVTAHPNAAKRIDRRRDFVRVHPVATGKVAANRDRTDGQANRAGRAKGVRGNVRQ